MPNEIPTISAYVPVYNGARYLRQTLDALLKQTHPLFEIIVVDDGSTDGSPTIAQAFPVRIVLQEKNRGIGATRTTAVREAEGELILAVDADCILAPDWVERCLPLLSDPHVAGVGGMLVEAPSTRAFDRWRARYLIQHHGEGTKRVPFLAGAATLMRTADLLDAGLYDEHYRRHHEDTDLSARLIARGRVLLYTSAARATHIKQDSLWNSMESAWGFRHPRAPRSVGGVMYAIIREWWFGLRIVCSAIREREWQLAGINVLYPFIQTWLCVREYLRKDEGGRMKDEK